LTADKGITAAATATTTTTTAAEAAATRNGRQIKICLLSGNKRILGILAHYGFEGIALQLVRLS